MPLRPPGRTSALTRNDAFKSLATRFKLLLVSFQSGFYVLQKQILGVAQKAREHVLQLRCNILRLGLYGP